MDLLLEAGAGPSGKNDEYEHWLPFKLALDRKQTELLRRGARIGLLEALMCLAMILCSIHYLAMCSRRSRRMPVRSLTLPALTTRLIDCSSSARRQS